MRLRIILTLVLSLVMFVVLYTTFMPFRSEHVKEVVLRNTKNPVFFHVNKTSWYGEIQTHEYTAIHWADRTRPSKGWWKLVPQEAIFDGWRPEGFFKVHSVKNIFGQHLYYRTELLRRKIDRDLATITGGEYVNFGE